MDHPDIELQFGLTNKALEETCYRDFDTLFIQIACDTYNACSDIINEMIESNALSKERRQAEHLKLVNAVRETLENMLKDPRICGLYGEEVKE